MQQFTLKMHDVISSPLSIRVFIIPQYFIGMFFQGSTYNTRQSAIVLRLLPLCLTRNSFRWQTARRIVQYAMAWLTPKTGNQSINQSISQSVSQSVNIGLLKDGKTHPRTNVSEKSTKYKIHDNIWQNKVSPNRRIRHGRVPCYVSVQVLVQKTC